MTVEIWSLKLEEIEQRIDDSKIAAEVTHSTSILSAGMVARSQSGVVFLAITGKTQRTRTGHISSPVRRWAGGKTSRCFH